MEIDIASFGRAVLFLGIPFVIMVFYFQWRWAKTCSENIRVLVAEKGGGGKWELAPKEGGEVTIVRPDGSTRTWAVNELATIDILYPGVGFVPAFMQKTIRLAIVNEGDWEPMLNRSPHRKKIASPDVVEFLKLVASKNPKMKEDIKKFAEGLSTGPTREMIADPAVLGSLKVSGVLKALASVSNDLLDTLKSINTRLSRFAGMNSMVIYIGLGLIGILLVFLIYQVMNIAPDLKQAEDIMNKIDAIQRALGVQ